jgi:hypothetical protein
VKVSWRKDRLAGQTKQDNQNRNVTRQPEQEITGQPEQNKGNKKTRTRKPEQENLNKKTGTREP